MSEENLEGLEAPEEEIPTTEEAGEEAEAAAPEEVKGHPAHDKLLAELPEAWHQKVLPHLQEQDKNFQSQLEKFSPYKQFIEDGIEPSYIAQSMQLAEAISSDPLTVHANLTKALMDQGLIKAEAEAAAKEIIDDSDDDIYEDEDLSPAMKKELAKRDTELNAIREQMSNADFERATQDEIGKLNEEFSNLTSSYEVSPSQERAILELMDAASARGNDLSVFDAAKKLVSITGKGFPKKGLEAEPAKSAPTVLGGSGGSGVPFEAVTIPGDAKAKREMLAEMFKNNQAK